MTNNIKNVLEALTEIHPAIENMAKKQVSSKAGISQTIDYMDIVQEVYALALEGKINVEKGSLYTTVFYTIQNITRKEVRRQKALSPLFEMEETEVTDEYSYTYYSDKAKRTYTKKVTYSRTQVQIGAMKQVAKRSDVQTVQSRSIPSNFQDGIIKKIDMENLFDETEEKVFQLMLEDKKKKEIDVIMGQRCDRIYKRIEKKLAEYMNE